MKDRTCKIVERLAYFFMASFVISFSVGFVCACTGLYLIAEICLWVYPISILGLLICGFILANEAGKAVALAVLSIFLDLDKRRKK